MILWLVSLFPWEITWCVTDTSDAGHFHDYTGLPQVAHTKTKPAKLKRRRKMIHGAHYTCWGLTRRLEFCNKSFHPPFKRLYSLCQWKQIVKREKKTRYRDTGCNGCWLHLLCVSSNIYAYQDLLVSCEFLKRSVDEGCRNSHLLATISKGTHDRNIRRYHIDVIGTLTTVRRRRLMYLKNTFLSKRNKPSRYKKHYDSLPTTLSAPNTKCKYCTLMFDRSSFTIRLKIKRGIRNRRYI